MGHNIFTSLNFYIFILVIFWGKNGIILFGWAFFVTSLDIHDFEFVFLIGGG